MFGRDETKHERTREERERAAAERAARRAGKPVPPPPEPAAPPPAPPAAPAAPRTPAPAAPVEQAPEPAAAQTSVATLDRPPRSAPPRRPPPRAAGPKRPPRWRRRVLALLALAGIGIALYVINATFQPLHGDGHGAVAVRIPAGADVDRIGEILESAGVVESARFFSLNATLTARRGKLRSGNYTLQREMSNGDAIAALQQGPKAKIVKTFSLTIPEGRSRREIVPLLEDTSITGDYLKATSERGELRSARRLGLPRSARTLEGFLFPATYDLVDESSARELVDKQLSAFGDNLAEVDLKAAKRRNLTRFDIVTIASMVERETQLARERPLVAAVIHNRLRRGMPLGIDATLRYALDNWTRPLRQSELERDSPYNTRLRRGLPPTPIGNPGLASLKAAARPARVPYLYYVVRPGTCGHSFSSTEAKFQADVERYNRERERNGGKSPTKC